MRLRYIPSDVTEDAKFFKVVPYHSLYYAGAAMLFGVVIFLVALRSHIVIGGLLVLLPPIAIILLFSFNIPNKMMKNIDLAFAKSHIRTLEDMCSIKTFDTICKTKNKKAIFLENKAYPFDYCPDAEKDARADEFAREIFNTVKNGIYVSVYGICAPEDTSQLENRLDKLKTYPPKLREIENERINMHYKISRSSKLTRYFTKIIIRQDSEEDLVDIARNFSNSDIISEEDIIKEVGSHLIVGTKAKRGRNKAAKDDVAYKEKGQDKTIISGAVDLMMSISKKLPAYFKNRLYSVDDYNESIENNSYDTPYTDESSGRIKRGRRNR